MGLPASIVRGARGGFTLIEMLVVVVVIAVLAALAFPAFSQVREGARAVACASNLRQIGAGLNAYLGENEMTMPTLVAARTSRADQTPVIDTLLANYVHSPGVFVCPADPHFARDTGTSYFWNSALNGQHLANLSFLRLTQDQSKIPVLSDKDPFHPYLDNKVNILYADGHATKDLKFRTE